MFYGGPVNIKRLFLKGNLLHSLRSVVFYRRTERRSRAKFGIDCLFFFFFGRFLFFCLLLLFWNGFCAVAVGVFCVHVCLSFLKKCKQRQLIEADILIVHGRRRARLKSSVNTG
jgi:ABC-type bacteriocin/lantibiotic exporter with double-glycine peptidase domain